MGLPGVSSGCGGAHRTDGGEAERHDRSEHERGEHTEHERGGGTGGDPPHGGEHMVAIAGTEVGGGARERGDEGEPVTVGEFQGVNNGRRSAPQW